MPKPKTLIINFWKNTVPRSIIINDEVVHTVIHTYRNCAWLSTQVNANTESNVKWGHFLQNTFIERARLFLCPNLLLFSSVWALLFNIFMHMLVQWVVCEGQNSLNDIVNVAPRSAGPKERQIVLSLEETQGPERKRNCYSIWPLTFKRILNNPLRLALLCTHTKNKLLFQFLHSFPLSGAISGQ